MLRCRVGRDRHPDRRLHRLPVGGHDTQPVVRAVQVRFAEHLGRPGNIEHLQPVEHHDPDFVRVAHVTSSLGSPDRSRSLACLIYQE
jgi:hypothetical protein